MYILTHVTKTSF